MYDRLRHYIAEGLVEIFVYPTVQSDGLSGTCAFARRVKIEPRKDETGKAVALVVDGDEYPITKKMLFSYGVCCESKEAAIVCKQLWMEHLTDVINTYSVEISPALKDDNS